VGNWTGHRPATSAAILALLTKACEGGKSFSYSERVLFVACEFWAAARGGELQRYLIEESRSKLREAEEAFGAIGLTQLESVLHRSIIAIEAPSSSTAVVRVLEELEKRFALIEEPVDEALETFARKRIFMDSNDRWRIY
jgi:hypothetical protein